MITEILTERQEALRAESAALLEELAGIVEGLDGSVDARVAEASHQLEDLFLLSLSGAPGTAVETVAAALVGEPPPRHLTTVPEDASGPAQPADLGLYLTSAHRPLAPAEHPLLQAAAGGADHLLVVVDEAEMLRLSEDLGRMEEAVAVAAGRILGRRPPVQMISTDRASVARFRESLLPALARRVVAVLRSPEVLRPKLVRPLDAAITVARERLTAVGEGLAALGDDLANLEVMERELAGFEERAEAALREAQEAAGRELSGFGERAGGLVRRGSRLFPPLRRPRERFEREGVAGLPDRLRRIGARLEEAIADAATAARRAVEDRVTSFPTEWTRSSREVEPGAERPGTAPDRGPVTGELDRTWHGGRSGEIARPLAASLRRTSLLAFVLLVAGLVFAAVPVLSAFGGGAGWLSVALGGGLGGAAILAALAASKAGRRRVTGELSGRVEELRAAVAEALATGSERAVAEGRTAIRAPVGRYAATVAAERDRLTGARDALERLAARLEGLRRQAARMGSEA